MASLDLDLERRGSAPILAAGDRRQEERREKKGSLRMSSAILPQEIRQRGPQSRPVGVTLTGAAAAPSAAGVKSSPGLMKRSLSSWY